MQFVVQLAQEITPVVGPPAVFTLWTMVATSGLLAGAERITVLAPATR
jgi:hypothetical protein